MKFICSPWECHWPNVQNQGRHFISSIEISYVNIYEFTANMFQNCMLSFIAYIFILWCTKHTKIHTKDAFMLIHYLSTVTLSSILLNFTSYEFLQSFQDRADSHDIAWVFGMVQHQSLGHIQCCASSVVHYRTSSPPHRTPRGTSAKSVSECGECGEGS